MRGLMVALSLASCFPGAAQAQTAQPIDSVFIASVITAAQPIVRGDSVLCIFYEPTRELRIGVYLQNQLHEQLFNRPDSLFIELNPEMVIWYGVQALHILKRVAERQLLNDRAIWSVSVLFLSDTPQYIKESLGDEVKDQIIVYCADIAAEALRNPGEAPEAITAQWDVRYLSRHLPSTKN